MRNTQILALILAIFPFVTTQAQNLVVSPNEAARFKPQAEAPAPMKPMAETPINPAAPPATVDAAVSGTAPAAIPTPQAAPQTGPVYIPTTPVPNINSGQKKDQAQEMIRQFLELLSRDQGMPAQKLPNGKSNPAYGKALGGSTSYNGEYGARVENGNYAGVLTGLNAQEAAKRLKNHKCSPKDSDRLTCMVCNLMYEAGGEPRDGQLAVVQSVMTRAFSGKYPDTVCEVVYQSNGKVAQYSWTLENKNHTLPNSDKVDQLVQVALEGMRQGPNGLTNYYAHNLVTPAWSRMGECAGTKKSIGNHTFCRINGVTTRTVAQYLAAEGLNSSSAPRSTGGSDESGIR